MLRPRTFEPRVGHVLLLVLATFVFYAGTLDNHPFKDDLLASNLTEGSELSARKVKSFLWPSHMTSEQFWRPLPMLHLALDFALWGTDPFGFHLSNTLLHALVAVLAYLLVNRLTGFRSPTAGLVAGLLAALSPAAPEAVVWGLQRMVLWSAVLSLFAILCWVRAADGGGRPWRLAGLGFLGAALLSKEVAMTLPASFFAVDLVRGERAADLRARLLRAGRRAIGPAILLAVYLGCRLALWGRITILYAGMEPMEYARHNRVFERLGESLFNGFVPVNAAIFPSPWAETLRAAMLLGLGLALIRGLLRSARDADFRATALVLGSLAVFSFAPTLPIFWVTDDLFNARFVYTPQIALLGIAAAALWLPSRRVEELPASHRRQPLAWIGSVALVGAFAVSLAGGLRAFEEASDQVASIRGALVGLVRSRGPEDAVVVAFNVPSTRRGVPTLEQSLSAALLPPLTDPGVACLPLLSTLDQAEPRSWWSSLEEFRDRRSIPWDRFVYAFCEYDPPGATPAFGALGEPEGESPPRLLAPQDGRALPNDVEAPTFLFEAEDGPDRLVLVLESAEAIRRLEVAIVPGENARREGGRVSYRLSDGEPGRPEIAASWDAVVRRPLPRPLLLLWRVERRDSEGRVLARSADRRLVVLNVLPR